VDDLATPGMNFERCCSPRRTTNFAKLRLGKRAHPVASFVGISQPAHDGALFFDHDAGQFIEGAKERPQRLHLSVGEPNAIDLLREILALLSQPQDAESDVLDHGNSPSFDQNDRLALFYLI
jgi:hypothetical protein